MTSALRKTARLRSVRSWLWMVAVVALVAAAAAYLYDPPWIGDMTSGLLGWQQEPSGDRYRWTTGRATFFVPSDAKTITLPLRAQFPGPGGTPVLVRVTLDDRVLADVVLDDPSAWVRPVLPLTRRTTHRRFRRVDVRVNRTVGELMLGVKTGEIVLEGAAGVH